MLSKLDIAWMIGRGGAANEQAAPHRSSRLGAFCAAYLRVTINDG
jgi:hypothetical protein